MESQVFLCQHCHWVGIAPDTHERWFKGDWVENQSCPSVNFEAVTRAEVDELVTGGTGGS